ncbi:hypothetical protein PILCRDRAFT_819260 [Piloderma croceum F 1598]|uniref:Uncharacterized protein n=1 Tax=Piloderma croceum (strain F 1598) TaxID=765440 RepID=A0A0C3FH23_PILCF|nr:hypothetical protein PILCRDRAFT_819260 [Piloderma croceum F 1598]
MDLPGPQTNNLSLETKRPPLLVKLTGYRLLVLALTSTFGIFKATFALEGQSVTPNSLDLAFGVPVTIALWWLGLYESIDPPVLAWFFHIDYSRLLATTIWLTLRMVARCTLAAVITILIYIIMVMATLPIIRLVLSIFRPDDRSVAAIIAVCMVVGFLEMLFIYTLGNELRKFALKHSETFRRFEEIVSRYQSHFMHSSCSMFLNSPTLCSEFSFKD